MKLVCCCLSQVFFFIKKLVSPDHHVEVQQHRSGGKGTRTTPHPAPQHIYLQPTLIPRTTPTPHTKGKREGRGKGKREKGKREERKRGEGKRGERKREKGKREKEKEKGKGKRKGKRERKGGSLC